MASSTTPNVEPASASLEERIRSRYDQMSPVEQKLADVILSYPGQVAMQTATELAASAQVSKATTTRFFRSLGYESYELARRDARKSQNEGSALYLQDLGKNEPSTHAGMQHHLEQEISNLVKTYAALSQAELLAMAAAIASARNVVVIGYRHSQTIATMIRRHLILIRSNILLLPAPGDSLAEYIAGLDHRDIAICVGLRRRPPQLESAMAAMAGMGVKLVYMSDVLAGKPARLATWVIRCQTESHLMFDSNTSVASVVNLLCSLVEKETRGSRAAHLSQVEALHQGMGEFE